MIRQPVVAGSFYPGESRTLKRELEEYIRFADMKKKVIGLISPHAGYVYSGPDPYISILDDPGNSQTSKNSLEKDIFIYFWELSECNFDFLFHSDNQ